MSWTANNSGQPPANQHDEHLRSFTLLNQTPNTIPMPSPVFNLRGRLNSVNSSFLSPMRLITSPTMNNDDLFEFQLKPADKEKLQTFRLDDHHQQPIDQDEDEPQQDSPESPHSPPTQNLSDVLELIRGVTHNLGLDDTELERHRRKYMEREDQQYVAVFDLLVRKLRKIKKTKEQMIKYCMRKVFRYLSEKIRSELTVGPRDNSQCLKYYFGKFENDKTFNVPFKKNSIQKTMNANFLAKVFSCPLFVEDYKKYMSKDKFNEGLFRSQAERDNNKKIDALAKVISKGIETKNLRKIDTFKRLPWTRVILNKSEQLAMSLLQYAKNTEPEKQSPTMTTEKRQEQESMRQLRHEPKQVKKGSIILLTPPMGPLSSPHIQEKIQQILKQCQ